MAYIYKITNKINQKCYIGKTEKADPVKRFHEHCQESKRKKNKKRPLYRAFDKYGIENFNFEIIEETSCASEREMHYIQFYNSYGHNGYNATFGGDGKKLYNYEEIETLILKGLTTKEIKEKIGCCEDTIREIAKIKGISLKTTAIKNSLRKQMEASKKPVNQLSLDGQYIQSFESYADAARWLKNNNYSTSAESGIRAKIGLVCNGKRKTAFKFRWEFVK